MTIYNTLNTERSCEITHGLMDSFRTDPTLPYVSHTIEMPSSSFIGAVHVTVSHRDVSLAGEFEHCVSAQYNFVHSDFRGCAAKLSLTSDSKVLAEVVLLHRKSELNVVLARLYDHSSLAGDWQMWAKRMNLPLVLIEPDGVEQVISTRFGAMDVREPLARRPRSHFVERRPRFLACREVGGVKHLNRVAGVELIARN